MRGIGISFSRLFSPKVIIAGAAILAGTAAPGLHADAQEKAASENRLNEQRAYAVPRVDPESGNGFAFPQPLNPSDAVMVRQIFALQFRGELDCRNPGDEPPLPTAFCSAQSWPTAYTGPHDKPAATDLIQWLKLYGDQPQASAVQSLLKTAAARPWREHGPEARGPAPISRRLSPYANRPISDMRPSDRSR